MKSIKMWVIIILLSTPLSAENIVVDLFGVLFDIPLRTKVWYAGVADSLGYVLFSEQKISKAKTSFLEMMHEIKLDSALMDDVKYSQQATAQAIPMPDMLIAWQAGTLKFNDALTMIDAHLSQSNYGYFEKRLFQNASRLTFDLDVRQQAYQPIPASIALLNRLAQEKNRNGQPRHALFLLSNMDKEIMEYLQTRYPDIFALFHGIRYSAQTKSLKPHKSIYRSLLKTYNLESKDCFMIDDQAENIAGAQAVGMNGAVFISGADMARTLEEKGLLQSLPVPSSVKPSWIKSTTKE